MTPNFSELFRALLPEAALVLGGLFVLGVDLTAGRAQDLARRTRRSAFIALVAVAAALYLALSAGRVGEVFGGALMLDSLALATRAGVLVLTGFTLALLPGTTRLYHPAEYIAILLFAATGFTLMAAAQQLLVAFLALELASLSLYVLAGYDKSSPASAEGALKYFLFGGVSAAFLLFGFSLLYGLTGSIAFPEIARQLTLQPATPLLIVALVMIVAALGFKAAAAPFHLWAPDVYQGAPASSAALIASASKLASFVLFARLLWAGAGPASGSIAVADTLPGWLPVLALLALASLLLGNIAALAQSNVRRLLAYSAIAHAGGLLLGVMASGREGPGPLYYYASTYGLATVGAFGVIAAVERTSGQGCQSLNDLAGLHRRSPLLAACLLVFILSLAGIPPLAGFFGKFAVFAAALKLGGLTTFIGWLTILAIALSAIALYYYLVILKQALVAQAPANVPALQLPLSATVALLLLAALVIALGLFPSAVLRVLA